MLIDRRQGVWIVVTLLVVLMVGSGIWFAQSPVETAPSVPNAPVSFEIPKITSSPFLNTHADAKYVGSTQCNDCHASAHQSYLETTHSRALEPVDPSTEPDEVTFVHEASSRRFRVIKKGDKVHHQEFLLGPTEDQDILLCDFPITYAIGSGNNARSYLVEVGGFLVESPITWYATKKAWETSPGYDRPNHASFSRAIDVDCLKCHTGRVEQSSENARIRFLEQRISCENCHGPGSLHVDLRKNQQELVSGIDYTIVNPAHLSRELKNAVCGQCHMEGVANALVRGRNQLDFRPGLPLTDFRIDYRLDQADSKMSVTGHFEQMTSSKCYSQSETLTCITCHNPHDKPTPENRIAHYRSICNSCHEADGGCHLDESERLAKSPMNDCTSCHMGRTDIQIPHLVFTHHRIGLGHSDKYEPLVPKGEPLTPIVSPGEALSQLDLDRCRALATLNYADTIFEPVDGPYHQEAFDLLNQVYEGGLKDGKTTATLAWMNWERESEKFHTLALEALEDPDCPLESRANALFLVAAHHVQRNEIPEARQILEQLVKLKLDANYWSLLAGCRAQLGDFPQAIDAFEKSLSLMPQHPETQMRLTQAYQHTGQRQLAAKHREVFERFFKLFQKEQESQP